MDSDREGWFTETGIDVRRLGSRCTAAWASFEETGAAQHLRARGSTTIYEARPASRRTISSAARSRAEGGATAKEVIGVMRAVEAELGKAPGEDMAATREAFSAALTAAEECVSWMVIAYGNDIKAAHAGAVPFLKLMGIACGGWQDGASRARRAPAALRGKGRQVLLRGENQDPRFYADHVLTQAPGLRNTIVHGAAGVMALSEDQF